MRNAMLFLEGLSVEVNCRVIGVALCDSSICLDTAFGVGGAVVAIGFPIGQTAAPRRVPMVGLGCTVGPSLLA